MGDLGATYGDHLRLLGKRVGDFLLVLVELFLLGRTTFCVFEPSFGGLETTYHVHLGLIIKRVVDFLFSPGRTAEALRAIIGSKSAISLQHGPVDPKFHVEGVAPTHHSSSQKTRLNELSRCIKIWTDFSSVLSQCTRLTDRQTDRQTDGRTDRQKSHR